MFLEIFRSLKINNLPCIMERKNFHGSIYLVEFSKQLLKSKQYFENNNQFVTPTRSIVFKHTYVYI